MTRVEMSLLPVFAAEMPFPLSYLIIDNTGDDKECGK